MLSTILSPFKLIPGFRPLFSGVFSRTNPKKVGTVKADQETIPVEPITVSSSSVDPGETKVDSCDTRQRDWLLDGCWLLIYGE